MRKNMMKIMAVILLVVMAVNVPFNSIQANAKQTTKNQKTTTKVKKPGQVKGLKKVKVSAKWDGRRRTATAKIKFNKVKGAAGYQVLIYQKVNISDPYLMTTIVWAKNTKKTTYTIQNLVPSATYTIKVRAYKKDKKGKVIYGKAKSIKVKTTGMGGRKGLYYACNCCGVMMPGNGNCIYDHGVSAEKIHNEVHAGGTFNTYK